MYSLNPMRHQGGVPFRVRPDSTPSSVRGLHGLRRAGDQLVLGDDAIAAAPLGRVKAVVGALDEVLRAFLAAIFRNAERNPHAAEALARLTAAQFLRHRGLPDALRDARR